MKGQPLSLPHKVPSGGVISIFKSSVPIKCNIESSKEVHLSSLLNNGGAGPSSLNTVAISYSLVYPAASTMENQPFTIISNGSSFVGFPSLLEISVVNKSNNGSKGGGHNLNRSKIISNKAISHEAGLSSQTEENTAGDEAIFNEASLFLKNEGLSTMDVLHNSMNVIEKKKMSHSSQKSVMKQKSLLSFFGHAQKHASKRQGLSYVAVGKPLYADSLTETMKRILYVRICVQIDATSKLIDSFDLLMGEGDEHNNGESVEILVEYQCKPKICPECKSFGHNAATCPSLKHLEGRSGENRGSKMKQEWVKVNRGASLVSILLGDINFAQIFGSEAHTIAANSKEEVVDTSNKFLALIEEE
ncbi:hypothetical protein Dsin_005712 [Dipteronia sinensis]|uniref:DUF4283 domain-containing protein n=1 Tax=Dipteronia sinensis TaxID=43782 RepID=A0AAE0EGR4_9ROSI|nr:hypothetical protein Dsin_005712 [Dipteronia sinensis]